MIYKKNIFVFLIFLVFLFVKFSAKNQQNFETIIGIVDGEVVTSYELSQRIKILLNSLNLEDNIDNRDKVREKVLQNLINDKLKILEANKLEIKIDKSELDGFVTNVFGIESGKIDDFKDYLSNVGIDHDIILEQAKAELLWKKIINAKFSSLIVVSEQEIKDEIEKYKNNVGMLQYNLSEIVVLRDNLSQNSALKKISEIKIMINNDASFESLASKFSDAPSSIKDGHLGWVFADQINKETQMVIEKTNINEVSNIIKFNNGYKIIKLHDKRKYGTNKNKNFDIINFSSESEDLGFTQLKNNLLNCDEDFSEINKNKSVKYTRIDRLELRDVSSDIQKELEEKKIGETTKIFEKNNKFFFFLICNISGDEVQEIDENIIDQKIYFKKVQQLSQTYLKRLNRNSNIKLLIN